MDGDRLQRLPRGVLWGTTQYVRGRGDSGVSAPFSLHLLRQTLISTSNLIRHRKEKGVIEKLSVTDMERYEEEERKIIRRILRRNYCPLVRPSQPRITAVLKSRPSASSVTVLTCRELF